MILRFADLWRTHVARLFGNRFTIVWNGRSLQAKGRPMSLYHFYFIDAACTSDGGTLDLPDDDAARTEAKLEAHDLLNDPGQGDWRNWTIRVTDETGRLVASIRIGDLEGHRQ
jgi:hypothetical protein